jgi:hypothetical protein
MADAKPKDNAIGCLTVFVLYVICAGIYQGWLWLDRQGYLAHTVDSVITADANWLSGETKACSSSPLPQAEAKLVGEPTGYVLQNVACDSGPEHKVKIKFYGRKTQPEVPYAAMWNCTKESDSVFSEEAFTCKQTSSW